MISDAIQGLAKAVKSVVSVREGLSGTMNLVSDIQIDKVKRELRNLYSFQDGLLGAIDDVIETKGQKEDKIERLRSVLHKTDYETEQAIEFLSSDQVQSNLRLDLATISMVRGSASAKIRRRETLHGMTKGRSKLSDEDVRYLVRLRRALVKLNEAIDGLDKGLAKNGLQARGSPQTTS